MSFKDHKQFKPPADPNCPIWRYMSITKFLSILENNSLFFPKLECLPDKYEGFISDATVKSLQLELINAKKRDDSKTAQNIKNILLLLRKARYYIFINSWHTSKTESTAMWNVYLNRNNGLAIKSTYGRLVDCFRKTTEEIHIGVVEYIDFDVSKIPWNNIMTPALYKRDIYEYEHELRAIYFTHDKIKAKGIHVSVELDRLIDQVILPPGTEDWEMDVINKILKNYELKVGVLPSIVDKTPMY